MIKRLLNLINNQKYTNETLSLLLIYIHDNNINNQSSLLTNLTKEYLEIFKKKGKIYGIYNEMFDTYGKNVYKLGYSTNLKKRLNTYITCYVKPCELSYESLNIWYPDIVESVLFLHLQQYRLSPNREFFDCDIKIIKNTMAIIINEFETTNIMDIINKYNMQLLSIRLLKSNILKLLDNYKNKLKCIIVNDTGKIIKISTLDIYEKIIESDNITDEEFVKYNSKKLDELNYEQKYSIEKYTIKKIHNIDLINTQILNNIYNSTQKYITVNYFKGISHILRNSEEWSLKKELINEIIMILGYNNIGEKLDRETFNSNKNKVITKSKFFTDSIKSHMLFGYDKLIINKVVNGPKTIKQFLGFINSVFNDWGLNIRAENRSSSKKIDGKKITTNNHFYVLNYIDDIDKYL
ncbi:hypothetical protein Indivirus_5_51 [Indivirus ILV1]|uniref:Bacteriophage T5 Orf172 DNA-binding domain-containing protein n=1 Tax=Indivirus ILV1 TaxID=1977633 RepID=A0A1V0SE60_9VIRU|nr:hypothetical protein Indivirus_5_51 [Indivirus ILV1]